MLQAIVYTSQTGYTAAYAKLLGERTGLPVYDLGAAKNSVAAGAEIIYLGWLMAGSIKGCRTAMKRYRVRAVCAVGMGASGTQTDEARKRNAVPEAVPLFTLQGGFDITKLHGIYKLMMNVMIKTAGRQFAAKTDRTPDEDEMLDMLLHGGNCVGVDNLAGVLAWHAAEPKD